jgi:predicted RNA-binding protein
MTSRQDSASIKRLKNESFEVVDFTMNYESPFEDYDEETHEQKYSSPQAMKSDPQTKVKLMVKGKHQDINAPKKEATPEWVINLMSSVKRLEQKVDNTMDEVDALKKKETAKQELQTAIKLE